MFVVLITETTKCTWIRCCPQHVRSLFKKSRHLPLSCGATHTHTLADFWMRGVWKCFNLTFKWKKIPQGCVKTINRYLKETLGFFFPTWKSVKTQADLILEQVLNEIQSLLDPLFNLSGHYSSTWKALKAPALAVKTKTKTKTQTPESTQPPTVWNMLVPNSDSLVRQQLWLKPL